MAFVQRFTKRIMMYTEKGYLFFEMAVDNMDVPINALVGDSIYLIPHKRDYVVKRRNWIVDTNGATLELYCE